MRSLVAATLFASSLLSFPAAAAGAPTADEKPGRKDKAAYEAAYKQGLKRFEQACKAAGRSVPQLTRRVPGIRLEIPPEALSVEKGLLDPGWAFAGMPRERMGDRFIASFLDFTFSESEWHVDFPGSRTGMLTTMVGFKAVDVLQKDGTYLRYRLKGKTPQEGMASEPVARDRAFRYAVRIEPLEVAGGRKDWVAGSRMRVVDGETGQVLGELRAVSFALPPQGVKASELDKRSWERSMSCPKYVDIQTAMARMSLLGIVDPPEYSSAPPDPASIAINAAVAAGVLREASWADADAWQTAFKASGAKGATGPRSKAGRSLQPSRSYIVLKPFALPEGLHGAHSAEFYVPKGVPRPTGDPGHSIIYDYNDMTCEGPGCRRNWP